MPQVKGLKKLQDFGNFKVFGSVSHLFLSWGTWVPSPCVYDISECFFYGKHWYKLSKNWDLVNCLEPLEI